jgi:hypothetical protein
VWKNHNFLSLQDTKELFYQYVDSYPIKEQPQLEDVRNLETFFDSAYHFSLKIQHPLFIKSWKNPMLRYKDEPLKLVGLDMESDHKTGEPKLLGIYWPNDGYFPFENPDLETLRNLLENLSVERLNMICWGNFDIQCLLRVLQPEEHERQYISRGLSAKPEKNLYPLIRTVNNWNVFVSHYLSRRSLKLGLQDLNYPDRIYYIWLFNCSQFYPGSIKQNSIGSGLKWINYPENTHLIDWHRYKTISSYKRLVQLSNKQDALSVYTLAMNLQTRFAKVFDCYPSLLVSTGSLTDTAVSKILSENPEDYKATSQKWITENVWRKNSLDTTITEFELLATEAFSAGYVDQFAIGYFKEVWNADLSSAYPSIIRNLPDLRYSSLFYGKNNLENEMVLKEGWTAIINGQVSIPQTLNYHPITMKTYHRENIRPTGTFNATYTWQEREFCIEHGATFSDESYVIVTINNWLPSPLAKVSQILGEYREILIHESQLAKGDMKTLFDGQQFVVKVIDNSLYGKTVQTMELIDEVDGSPVVSGYTTGDRYNMLYGLFITSCIRIQIAKACNSIKSNGGTPIMTMTDAIYWLGDGSNLPSHLIATTKTAGMFEPSHMVKDFYLLKTGQYEYQDQGKWSYKLRGLNVDFSVIDGKESFYRKLIKSHTANLPHFTNPKSIEIVVPAKKLITIGSQRLENLALIDDTPIKIRPFVLSDKQIEGSIKSWKDLLDSYQMLKQPHIINDKPQLDFLNKLYLSNEKGNNVIKTERKKTHWSKSKQQQDLLKLRYIIRCYSLTGKSPPEGRSYRLSWEVLTDHYKIERLENEK